MAVAYLCWSLTAACSLLAGCCFTLNDQTVGRKILSNGGLSAMADLLFSAKATLRISHSSAEEECLVPIVTELFNDSCINSCWILP